MGKQTLPTGLGFDDRLLRLVGVPVVAFLVHLFFFRNHPFTPVIYLRSVGYTWLNWEGCRLIIIWGNRRFPELSQYTTRLGWIALLGVLFIGITCIPIGMLITYLLPSSVDTGKPNLLDGYAASYMMMLSVGAVYESIRFFTFWKEAVIEKEQAERAHLASQLEGLRNQVNPHFLFNSLNTLMYLIPDDPKRAMGFVQQLSRVYRYMLENREARLIPLREELSFLDAYIFLLRERFGDNLRIDLRTDALPADAAIVPLTLQILFENAIKHNVISAKKPLLVEVFPENGHLIVRNNLQPKNQVMDSTGVGLENIQLRYRMLSGKELAVIHSGNYFTVALPMISMDQA